MFKTVQKEGNPDEPSRFDSFEYSQVPMRDVSSDASVRIRVVGSLHSLQKIRPGPFLPNLSEKVVE